MLLVVAVRACLTLLPFRILRTWALRAAKPSHKLPALFPADRLIQVIAAASRYVPFAACLTQGLSAHILLGRYGYPSHLRIGVAKSATGSFEAHAWLEFDGVVVLGGSGTDRFTQLLSLGNDPA